MLMYRMGEINVKNLKTLKEHDVNLGAWKEGSLSPQMAVSVLALTY